VISEASDILSLTGQIVHVMISRMEGSSSGQVACATARTECRDGLLNDRGDYADADGRGGTNVTPKGLGRISEQSVSGRRGYHRGR
jgi:hypothetical protein